jgi:D-serine deaminase-like pyridoxal phosphate-dependent protein
MRFPATIHDLETPALLVERARLEANLLDIAGLCRENGVRLRPHVKTHKCVELARLQHEAGAEGLTCAKVSEAAVFAEAGFRDLLVAYPLTEEKARVLRELAERTGARVSTVADSAEGIRGLSAAWRDAPEPLPVHLKVDTGLHRVGVPVENAESAADLARGIAEARGLRLAGLLTHEGHTYLAASSEEVARIGREAAAGLVALAEELRAGGVETPGVSVGSTPSARHSVGVPGVTELRPGNYVYHDAIQLSLGTAPLERCALTIWTTAVSRPARERAACDAGSKVFSSDRGPHGMDLGGHGIVLAGDGACDEGVRLAKLSEEHGWLRLEPDHPLRIGDHLRVVPAHACAAVNLAEAVWVVEGERVLERWPVAARARVT